MGSMENRRGASERGGDCGSATGGGEDLHQIAVLARRGPGFSLCAGTSPQLATERGGLRMSPRGLVGQRVEPGLFGVPQS